MSSNRFFKGIELMQSSNRTRQGKEEATQIKFLENKMLKELPPVPVHNDKTDFSDPQNHDWVNVFMGLSKPP